MQNTGAVPVSFSLEVTFDLTTLTNAVPLTNGLLAATTVPRYFQYDVSSNATAVAFELLNPTGELNLVHAAVVPLPDEVNFWRMRRGRSAQTRRFWWRATRSRWRWRRGGGIWGCSTSDVAPVSYTLEALELGAPVIIPLTNNQAYATNFSPGQALTTFFEFSASRTTRRRHCLSSCK